MSVFTTYVWIRRPSAMCAENPAMAEWEKVNATVPFHWAHRIASGLGLRNLAVANHDVIRTLFREIDQRSKQYTQRCIRKN